MKRKAIPKMKLEHQSHRKMKKEKRKQKQAMQGCLKSSSPRQTHTSRGTNYPDHNLKTINAGKKLSAALTGLSTISKPEALGMTKIEVKEDNFITCRNYERP